jgi:hypothetical protein
MVKATIYGHRLIFLGDNKLQNVNMKMTMENGIIMAESDIFALVSSFLRALKI